MILTFRKVTNNSNYCILNALENNLLVGSIMGVVCDELYGNCNPFIVIENFIVDKDHQKKGIGRKLFEQIDKYAKAMKYKNIFLVTDSERISANTFYQSMGFNPDSYKGYKKSLISKIEYV